MKIFLLSFVFVLSVHLKSSENIQAKFPKVSELFQKYLNQTNSTIKDYQLNLLKNRNHECLLKNYANLIESEIKFTNVSSENILNYLEYSSSNENFTNSTGNLFENSVSIYKKTCKQELYFQS